MFIRITFYRLVLIVVLLIILAIAVMGFLSFPAMAPNIGLQPNNSQSNSTIDSQTFPAQVNSQLDDEAVTAKSYLVYDMKTNQVIASRLPNTVGSIASLTKLMTGYLVDKYGSPSDIITITAKDELNISPVLKLQRGDKIKVADLFSAMMVGSANDAALTLGLYIETKLGKPIAEIMNNEAKTLGMKDTHYSTPVGFDSDTNYSTATDLALLVRKTTQNPSFISIDRLRGYSFISETGKSYSVSATNKLLAQDSEIHAIKTGFTDDAGGAMIISVQNPTNEFVIILLNSQNREQDTLLLKNAVTKKLQTQ